jgi:RAB6A-GEF complex partner protein 2
MSTPLTNIRVFVQWAEQTVFAGEEIECQITFKNIATVPAPSKASLHPSAANGFASGGERHRKTPTSQIKTNSALSSRPSPPNRSHRTSLSLSTPGGHTQAQSPGGSWNGEPSRASKDGGTHKRSVSIISIGASEGAFDDLKSHGSLPERPRGMSRGHGRSASLQIVPRRYGVNGGPPSGRRESH